MWQWSDELKARVKEFIMDKIRTLMSAVVCYYYEICVLWVLCIMRSVLLFIAVQVFFFFFASSYVRV